MPVLSIRTWIEIGLAVLLVLALGAVGLERDRHSRTRIAFADFKAQTAHQEQQRERVAREDAQEVSRLQARHATRQQEIIHAFYQARERNAAAAAARRTDTASVWNLANAYAASRGREAQGDDAACRSAKAGLREITALLAEGHELVIEGQGIIEDRDAELKLCTGIVDNDRALMAP